MLVTRARGDNGTQRALLEAAGVAVVEVPLIAFRPTGAPIPALEPNDLVVLTSATAVGQLVARRRVDLLYADFVAAVGPSTARAMQSVSRAPDLVPRRALADALAEALGDLRGRRVLYPRAETVPPDFEARLRQAGAELIPIPLYETVCPEGSREAMISARPFSVITLASGSAARHLAALGLDLEGVHLVAIGPSTAGVAERAGLEVRVIARPHTAEGLVAATLSLLAAL
ncbi:MAG: uroporphyrinogen-III synthase [Alphaproteobacteria bacterium]|nr:uroporphyrinogen-III synthase [Alphaproteobacteria bacterium]MCB9793514.1 uroporphyrinogen-III synthase [Alphaproteobacteria bacterium]